MRILLIALLCSAPLCAADFEIGTPAPALELGDHRWNTPEGFETLEDYRGKVVMIEIWASY